MIVVNYFPYDRMKIRYVQLIADIIQWHKEGDVLDAEMIVFAENINQPFAHVAIDTALDGVINRGNPPFHLKKNIKEPLGIGVEMLPTGDKHVVAYGFVTVIHRLLKGVDILRRTFLNNLTEHFPVLGNMILTVLFGIADTPVTGYRQDDVVFL